LFVSHDMSAILRLTEEALLLEGGQIALRAPSQKAVDIYLASGLASEGQYTWEPGEPRLQMARPFRPLALRVLDRAGVPTGRVLSAEPFSVEFEYELEQDTKGLRVGLYLFTSRGEPVFTTFDTDDPQDFERLTVRRAGRYRSRCSIPPNLLNEGRFVLGVNASAFRIRSFFTDEHALSFSVDGTGAPGSHWAEPRRGPLRPALAWEVAEAVP
jgi:lipopolysaccharide transport system ATP-binding protein